MSDEVTYPEPLPQVCLAIYIKKQHLRFEIPLDKEGADAAERQLKEQSHNNQPKIDNDDVAIWLVGSLKWESEEQYQYHLKKRKEKGLI